jgi:hypothetical protein
MSVKDKLEIGLKPDAPYRPDNLPDREKAPGARETARTRTTRQADTPARRRRPPTTRSRSR